MSSNVVVMTKNPPQQLADEEPGHLHTVSNSCGTSRVAGGSMPHIYEAHHDSLSISFIVDHTIHFT